MAVFLSPIVGDFQDPFFGRQQQVHLPHFAPSMRMGTCQASPVGFRFPRNMLVPGRPAMEIVPKAGSGDLDAKVDVSGFDPEEVKVEVRPERDGTSAVVVEAKKEEEKDGFRSFRQMKKVITVPEGCDADKIEARFTKRGVLEVTAPKKKEQLKEEQKKEDQPKQEPKKQEQKVEVEIHAGQDSVETKAEAKSVAEKVTKVAEAKVAAEEVEVAAREVKVAAKEVAVKKVEPFKTEVDVSGFAPEEISVELSTSGRLTVKAVHEDRTEEESVVRSVRRIVEVDPARFDLSTVRTEMDEESGALKITAEAVAAVEEEKGMTNIPVNVL